MTGPDFPEHVHGDFVCGDQVKQQGAHNIGIVKSGGLPEDLSAIFRFVDGVEKNLAKLPLDADSRQDAISRIHDIRQETGKSAPNHPRLRALAKRLRAIVEGAAGDAIAAYLIRLWVP